MVLLGVAASGWYYADEILVVPVATEAPGDTAVVAVDPEAGTVVLERTSASVADGIWGLGGAGWYAQLGPVLDEDASAGAVTRSYTSMQEHPFEGDLALIDGYAYPDDAGSAFEFPVEEVVVPGPLGDLPALLAPGERDTWVILVHGRGARRSEPFRLLPALVERGLPSLVVSYRNDPDAPRDPEGRYGLGWTEWEDVAAAVDWAAEQGAQDVVLVGMSMGGAIVGRYEALADGLPVRAMILDAPVVEWGRALRAAARQRDVPVALTPVAQGIVTLRTGLRWGELSLLGRADELDVPILLFHGDADDVVPVEGSDALAEARPDLVTYVRVPGAGHVQSWNVDPEAYDAALDGFLAELGL